MYGSDVKCHNVVLTQVTMSIVRQVEEAQRKCCFGSCLVDIWYLHLSTLLNETEQQLQSLHDRGHKVTGCFFCPVQTILCNFTSVKSKISSTILLLFSQNYVVNLKWTKEWSLIKQWFLFACSLCCVFAGSCIMLFKTSARHFHLSSLLLSWTGKYCQSHCTRCKTLSHCEDKVQYSCL